MSKSLVKEKFGAAAADYAASAVHAKGPSLARVVELVAPQSHWRALDVATGGGIRRLRSRRMSRKLSPATSQPRCFKRH